MLTISQPAYERISELLSDRPDDVCVRVYLQRGRARLRPGRQRQGDSVIEHDGRSVLVLDQQAARHLNRRTIGTRDTPNGPRLRLQKVQSKDQTRG